MNTVMQGETEVNLGTVVPASDLTEPPVITLSNDGDCLYAVIIVCAYEKCLNGTETPEEEPEEETEEPEEDCVDEESEEELEEPEEEEMTDEEMAEEDMAEEEMPGYGYEYETLAACTNLDSDLDLVSGCELPYRPPTLTPGAGTKQCIVVVYKQDQEIDGEQTAEVCRTGVAPCQFRDDFCLPDPYAANYYNIDDVAQAMAEC
ncbi:uncharacterized protein [Maniola hyperantus]|uniref:uncharacterized protein n=1 Tax=Aphantopus hyperantus TaxID=2795564 RepID=UPI003748CF90